MSPGYGYDLKRAVEKMTDGLVSLDLPGTYRILRRFEDEGVVESAWVVGESGPRRREYTLTSSGWDLLADWRRFLDRQRRACTLATAAMDAALGSPEAGPGRPEDCSMEAVGPGGDA